MRDREAFRKKCNNPEHFDHLVKLMSNAETNIVKIVDWRIGNVEESGCPGGGSGSVED